MKIDELDQHLAQGPLDDEEDEDDFPELSEDESNLSETLALLEDCGALLTALNDPLMNPKGKISKYFKREIKKVGQEVTDLLTQYNISVEE